MNLNHRLKTVSCKEIAPNIILVTVKGEERISFFGGQYFSFRIAERINRSYSIASAPENDLIEFVIDIAPQGPGSQFVQNLKVGDEFDAMGPFGFFTLEKAKAFESEEPLIFVATGTGIAPMRSMVLDLLKNKKSNREIYLYYGLRYDTEAYFFDEMTDVAIKYPNFSFNPVISRPTENWKGNKGYVQDFILQKPVIESAKIFVCGSNKNVDSITQTIVEYGYPRENIFFEKFG